MEFEMGKDEKEYFNAEIRKPNLNKYVVHTCTS